MKLYFNGCSFTYGDELKNPKQDAWPSLVSSCLGFNFVNDAVLGGTNDRIVYNTVQNINQYDYFFIAWTFYTRFTERNPVDNFEINFTPGLNLDASLQYSDDQLLNEHLQIQELHLMINKSTFIEWNSWTIEDLKSIYPCGPCGHILEDGHCAVANKVVEYYNKKS